ncbi:isoflavone reductase family protein-like protein [Cryomyces antarcticus]
MLKNAGGNLGPSILKALRDAGTFNISILSRADSKTDYSEESLLSAFKGQDAIIAAISGANAAEVQKKMTDAAVQAGVKRFIPGEFGTKADTEELIKKAPIFGAKKEVTDYLKTKERDGLTWTGVITSGFFDWGLEVGFLGYDLENHKAVIYNSGSEPHFTTTRPTIGKAVAAVLSKPEDTANKYIFVASFQTTQNEVLASLEKASRKKWEISETTSEESHKLGMNRFRRGDVGGSLQPLILSVVYDGEEGTFEELDNRMLELPREDLDETVKAIYVGRFASKM